MELTKPDFVALIEKQSSDTIGSHLKSIFFGNYVRYGMVDKETVRIWESTYRNRAFHPVLRLYFKNEKLIKIKHSINAFGFLLFNGIGLMLLFLSLIHI